VKTVRDVCEVPPPCSVVQLPYGLHGKMFTGPYSHRVFDGIGHNVPQEAPQQFADAIVAVDRY
jgi:pimeloyl-ACP methyl ester carboxylesterase